MSVLVHKAVEPEKLTKIAAKRLEAILAAGTALVYAKYDGVYAQYIYNYLDAEWQAFSRTNERLRAGEHPNIIMALDAYGKKHRRYIGELWIPGAAHPVINGLARKKTPQELLHLVVHDVVIMDEGAPAVHTYAERAARIVDLEISLIGDDDAHVHMAQRIPLTKGTTYADLLDIATKFVNAAAASSGDAYDGLIIRDPHAYFVPGTGTGGGIVKVKPRKSLDLRVVGETVEQRETKLGGYITVEYKGVTTDVGSGLTQAQLQAMQDAVANDFIFEPVPVYVGKIVEIEFLDITKDGKLREPVFKSIRHDKTTPD